MAKEYTPDQLSKMGYTAQQIAEYMRTKQLPLTADQAAALKAKKDKLIQGGKPQYVSPTAPMPELVKAAQMGNKPFEPAGGLSAVNKITENVKQLVQPPVKAPAPQNVGNIGVGSVNYTPTNFDYQGIKDQLADVVVPEIQKYRDPNFLDLLQAALAGFSGGTASYGKQRSAFDQAQIDAQQRAIQQNQWNRQYNLQAQNQGFQNALAQAQLAASQGQTAADVALQNRNLSLEAQKANQQAKLQQEQIDASKQNDLSALFSQAGGL